MNQSAGTAPAGAAGERWPGCRSSVRDRQRAGRDGPCERGAAGRDGPADLARLGSSLQRRRDCRAQQPSGAGALAEVDRGPDGGAEGGGAGRARSGGGRRRALAHCRSVPLGGGALGCQLQRDRDAAAVVVIGSVAPQDPAAPSANRREGTASLQKGGFAVRLSEITQAHPEAERFEIWSQDEARVGQKGPTGYVWWQRGQTPPRVARCWPPVGLDYRGRLCQVYVFGASEGCTA